MGLDVWLYRGMVTAWVVGSSAVVWASSETWVQGCALGSVAGMLVGVIGWLGRPVPVLGYVEDDE
jgi:hypothetical protein